MIEVLVAMTITVVAVGMLVRTLLATSAHRAVHRERAQAVEGARGLLERMRNAPFAEIFALYNHDPDDDPGGAGTAPGPFFRVPRLRPLDDAPGGRAGEVRFPSSPDGRELREDVSVPALGLPRDLDGDNVVDDEDHADDYLLLPVEVVVRWRGRHGPREHRVFTMLAEFRKGGP